MAMGPPNPFDSLPIETNQHIASFIESDQGICSFRLVCRSTYLAIEGDNRSFWRRRFLKHFDDRKHGVGSSSNIDYQMVYQDRKKFLKKGTFFLFGDSAEEIVVLEILKDILIDAFRKPGSSGIKNHSFNLEHIKRFLGSENLLHVIFRPNLRVRSTSSSPTPLLQTIQVLMAPYLLSLTPDLLQHHYGFLDSQYTAYSSRLTHPIFFGYHGLDIDMDWLLHQVNFWRHHMCREVEQTLYYALNELEEFERPKWWSKPLSQDCRGLSIGHRWKGSYTFVDRHEVFRIRQAQGDCEYIQDGFAGEDRCISFQDLYLHEMRDGESSWPLQFEEILQSLTPPTSRAKTRAQKRSASHDEDVSYEMALPVNFSFKGDGSDISDEFLAEGWLNQLPPQHGIPGWQRMTMMKYYTDEVTGLIDEGALWAYEGVVLPGGQIILGRWWYPDDGTGEEMYSGPFILWCVDGAETKVSK